MPINGWEKEHYNFKTKLIYLFQKHISFTESLNTNSIILHFYYKKWIK